LDPERKKYIPLGGRLNVPLTDEEIRRDLLGGLYRRAVERPEARWVSRVALKRGLKVSDEVLISAVSELEGKGLVETVGDPWNKAIISEKGLMTLEAQELNYCPHL
jgi:hypothetical protein